MTKQNIFVLDIETNGLLSNMIDFSSFPYKLREDARLWCIVLNNVSTGEVFTAVKEEITLDWMKTTLMGATHIVAHNGVKFDFLALKLFGVFDYHVGYLDEPDLLFGSPVIYVDTLILSRLFNPDRFGGHSLSSWGERVGEAKTDFRQLCVDKGYIEKNATKGAEFKQFCPEMIPYCQQDTFVTFLALKKLTEEKKSWGSWDNAIKVEHKLADLAIRRESFGFAFDKEAAVKNVLDLEAKMQELADRVNPILPPKKMNKGELSDFTPAKTQFTKNGTPSSHLLKFCERTGAKLELNEALEYSLSFEGKTFPLPTTEAIKTHIPASIDNLDHVKSYLIELGWVPIEWRERDLTKDSKKQSIPYEKRVAALKRWATDTYEGKYKEQRMDVLGITDLRDFYNTTLEKLKNDKPVRVPTSPCVRVGVEKELCPNLTAMGDSVSFAKDFTLYLTYRHRKNSIAGGDIEDMDFDLESPNTGYLAQYREVDGRIPTPAIEIGTNTSRMRHKNIANLPKTISIYGTEIRSLFGAGEGYVTLGYDFSSLEGRITGDAVYNYDLGKELAEAFVAEKPDDLHSKNAVKLGLPRQIVKSLTFGILYGSQPAKIAKMLQVSTQRAEELYNEFWDAVPALKQFKEDLEYSWEKNNKEFVEAIDGRKIMTRSKHSLLNAIIQTNGSLSVKYTIVYLFKRLEELGYCIDPFVAQPAVCEMITYHDEQCLAVRKDIIKYATFETEEDAVEYTKSHRGAQLGSIGHGKKYYVALPNPITIAIEDSIRKTEARLKMNVKLGFEYAVGNNWADCH